MEINLAKDVKDGKKVFIKYISKKRKTRENMGLLLNEVGVLVTEDTEKMELLNAVFASVFTAKISTQESQSPGDKRQSLEDTRLSLSQEALS